MAAKRFRSKIDRWILALLVIVIIVQVVAVGGAALQAGDPLATTGLIMTMIAIIGLMVWLLVGTHYTVDGDTLRIVSGPFRWKIAIDTINAVESTRSPISSPALSLDRLRLRYGNKRSIMISPADKAGFLRAIGHEQSS